MFGLRRPTGTITLTQERYDEIMEVHRAAEDLSALLIDFAGSRLSAPERFLEISATTGLPKAMVEQAISELREAIAISTAERA